MRDCTIWVVVPCHRPDQLERVVGQFGAQNFHNKKLCIVENGRAVGGCARLNLHPHLVVTSKESVIDARNTGMYAIRDLNDDSWIAMWDDDDVYMPGYLDEVAEAISSNKAEVYGKQRHFTAFPDFGLVLFNERAQCSYSNNVHGPSIVFRADEGALYSGTKDCDDFVWCTSMRNLGARIWSTSIHHLLYVRTGTGTGHVWQADDGKVAESSMLFHPAYSLGEVRLDLVSGAMDWKDYVLKKYPAKYPAYAHDGETVKRLD